MSSLLLPDREWGHLYPPFAEKLQAAMADAQARTGTPYGLVEGYRSQERQSQLYAQGRTRPGPIVTWLRFPKWHGAGVAADSAPLLSGQPWWSAPLHLWDALKKAGERQGLENPVWHHGDRGHLQWTDQAVQAHALAWVRSGFAAAPGFSTMASTDGPTVEAIVKGLPAPGSDGIRVLLDGHEVPDAAAYLRETKGRPRAWLWARAVLEQAECALTPVEGGLWVHRPGKDARPVQLSGENRNGKLFIRACALHALGWGTAWNGPDRRLEITTTEGN